MLRVWKWEEGKLASEIAIPDFVKQYIKVARKKPRRGGDRSGGEDDEEAGKKLSSRQRRRQKKKKKNGNEAKDGEDGMPEETDKTAPAQEDMEVDNREDTPTDGIESAPKQQNAEDDSRTELLLAIQKIETIDTGSSKLLVFSLYGSV